jgi:hypothetical protein
MEAEKVLGTVNAMKSRRNMRVKKMYGGIRQYLTSIFLSLDPVG